MTRSATDWHKTTDCLGRTILYITSDEATVDPIGVCSIHDTKADWPSYRLFDDGERRDMDPEIDSPYPENGLVVLGSSKFSRPDLIDTAELTAIHGLAAVLAILKAHPELATPRLRLAVLAIARHGRDWQNATARDLDINSRQISRWRSGQYQPKPEHIAELAEMLRINGIIAAETLAVVAVATPPRVQEAIQCSTAM